MPLLGLPCSIFSLCFNGHQDVSWYSKGFAGVDAICLALDIVEGERNDLIYLRKSATSEVLSRRVKSLALQWLKVYHPETTSLKGKNMGLRLTLSCHPSTSDFIRSLVVFADDSAALGNFLALGITRHNPL
ncbi:hypothetical protein C5167_011692 [Papaver somniferum]|uniref:Uncharacterized protein n=1 Tax=Papaver somniferum TaxID=3469 RepID=A0A4Y7K6P5_PAPSO|nr:hypothetical protein C5167_011692 [Papaver somniferum]